VARKTKIEAAKAKARAMELYLDTNMTQQEIADIVLVNSKTISNWVREGDWNTMKVAKTITPAQIIQDLYAQVDEMNKAIAARPKGERFPTSAESDARNKIMKDISSIDKSLNIGMYYEVLGEFSDWLEAYDIEKAKEFTPLSFTFFKHKLTQLNGKI